MTKDEIKHINWMYNRLTGVHKENPNLDYMIKFKEIIDQQLILSGVSNAKRTVCEKHVCVESKVNVGYRVCVNCYALFPIAN